MVSRLSILPLVALIALAAVAAGPAATVDAQTAPQTPTYVGPEVFLSTPVTSMLVDRGKQVTFSIDVNNKSRSGKFVSLELVKAPEGWDPILKDRGFVTRAVFARPDGLESVDLQVKVPADAKAEDHEIVLRGTGEGFEPTTLRMLIGVKEKATEGTKLTVQYPTLRGKSGSTFGFKADLANDSEEERSFGLSYKAPDGWDVSFKPSYEEKQISNVRIKSGSSQGLDVTVTPPARAQAGEYPITVTASSPVDRATVDLQVTLTGEYRMALTTRGDRFNTEATAGQESPFYITVTNTGSARLENVNLSTYKPEGWAVAFKPEKVDSLEPNAQLEVAMMIKPSPKAIAGDYMLNVSASHPQISMDRDVRVTVETPTLWGWVAMGILVVVIGGLLGMFMKLGRR